MSETDRPTDSDLPWPPPQPQVEAPPLSALIDPPSAPGRFSDDPEPEPCSCPEAAWLRRKLKRYSDTLVKVHNEQTTPPHLKRLLKETMGLEVFCCCHPECPGYPYRASDLAHPNETCGAKVIKGRAAAGVDREGTPEGARRLIDLVLPRVERWLVENAPPERATREWDWADLTLKLRYEGDDDVDGRAFYRCHFTETLEHPDAEGSG